MRFSDLRETLPRFSMPPVYHMNLVKTFRRAYTTPKLETK